MKITKLKIEEMKKINGGVDEPAYSLGYLIGSALNAVDTALGEFFFGDDSIWQLGRY